MSIATRGEAPARGVVGIGVLCALLAAGCRGDAGDAAASASPDRADQAGKSTAGLPNIVFAVYDNTRFDRYSINGNTRKTSPLFDRLASEGIYIAKGIAPATWTVPSHASMFTGYRNHQLKVDNGNPNYLVLETGVHTIAQILAERGYLTVSYPDHPYFGPVNASLTRGFRFFDILFNPLETPSLSYTNTPDGQLIDRRITIPKPTPADTLSVKAEHRRRLGKGKARYVKPPPEKEVFPPVKPYVGKYVARRYATLMEVLGKRGESPFFLFLNLHNGPLHLTTLNENSRWLIDYLERNELGPVPVDRSTFNRLDNTFLKSDYVLAFCDATLEALYTLFSASPGLENTVYVIASDHGQAHGEHGERKFYKHALALPWHYMVHAPAVIHFPESMRAGMPAGRLDDWVSLTDLFFTIAEIADAASDENVRRAAELNGKSILARMREKHYDECVVSESYMVIPYREIAEMLPGLAEQRGLKPTEKLIGNVYAFYKDRYKFVYAPQCRISGRTPAAYAEVVLLFDLQSDPEEMRNIAEENPELVEEFMGCFRRHKDIEQQVDFKAMRALQYDPKTLKQLKALGYVQDD